MAINKPVPVPKKNITTTDVISFNGGLDQRGDANAAPNTFTSARNAMVNTRGLLTHRYGLKRWLPDTVGTVYQIFPALYNGEIYYIVADDGKLKYCQSGDAGWTDFGGDNDVNTDEGVINTFLRVQDVVMCLNGHDKLRYVDLETMEVVQYTLVTNPANAPTAAATGITGSGSYKVYYSVAFNSNVGVTASSPILTQAVSKSRDTWKADGTEYLTITRNNTAPTGAVSWNLYVSIYPAGGTIAVTDMLPLAYGLDLSVLTFVDNGSLPIELSRGTAPEDNSTDGPICTYGIETDGRPVLFGDVTDPYAINIGGIGDHAIDFSPANGGYKAIVNKGTNYYPTSIVGFRNGQGVPSLTVLFSNTQGLSKQAILEQNTVTYGNYSFVVWGITEQNYGSAGVSSPYAVVNYNGGLNFPSTDGFMTMNTQAQLQNVLATSRISDRVEKIVGTIRNAALGKIVGTGWSNRIYWTIPSRGYSYNNEILVYDVTNKDNPIFYSLDIRAQWIGTISPNDQAAFVYITQDNHIFRFQKAYVAQDENTNGTTTPFPVSARGTLLGMNESHSSYKAVVQVVFYIQEVIGQIELGVTYRNENGRLKTKSKIVTQGEYASSAGGGWSSPPYLFSGHTLYNQWSDVPPIEDADVAEKTTLRVRLPLNVIASELQWFVNTNLDNSSFILRSVSYEGEEIGVKVDLR